MFVFVKKKKLTSKFKITIKPGPIPTKVHYKDKTIGIIANETTLHLKKLSTKVTIRSSTMIKTPYHLRAMTIS